MKPPSILVAYPIGGEHVSLNLFENLEPLGSVTLRTYARLKAHEKAQAIDVVLCVVLDDASIEEAHDLQQRLVDVPTIVVDHTPGSLIPINGFVGLVSPVRQEITKAVKDILHTSSSTVAENLPPAKRELPSSRAALVSRFDVTLSRLGGLSESFEATLAAATRQLVWELRAESAEAYVLDSSKHVRQIYSTSPDSSDDESNFQGIARVLKTLGRLTCIADLTRRADAPLREYLESKGLNVVAPMMSSNRLIGWLAFGLNDSMLNDDFLDDLHIATHLLNLTLTSPGEEKGQKKSPWHDVLTALDTGMLILDRDGNVVDLVGETLLLGSSPTCGESFKAIRSGRIREIIAEALRGNFISETWVDSYSERPAFCSATALTTERVALSYGFVKSGDNKTVIHSPQKIELPGFLESLPVPVVSDGFSGSSAPLPKGHISLEDSENIRRCADIAKSQNAKTLRVRFQPEGRSGRAVLFFETPPADKESHLGKDITQAVEFDVSVIP